MRVLLIFSDMPPEVAEQLRRGADVLGPVTPAEDWQTPLREVEAVIVGMQPYFSDEVLAQAPNLRVIGRPGIGVDNIDLSAATAHGVCVVNTPDAPTEPVAEKVVGWLLMLAHRLFAADQVAREAGWPRRASLRGIDLAGKTLGLIGLGRVGRRVAQICSDALGMKVLACDPFADARRIWPPGIARVASVMELLPVCDFVSLHCPLTPQTRGMFGEQQFRAMKSTAYLINSARGPIADHDALVRALKERWIAGAALDVFDCEPPSPDDPLLALNNVILAPHIGSFTREGVLRMTGETVEQVLMVLRGERPQNLVNGGVWEIRRA